MNTLPNITSHYNSTLKLNKSYILNKKINILACTPILSPINDKNFINLDIKTTRIPILNQENKNKEYVISFVSYEYLDFFKNHVKHPYHISKTKISDISYFLDKMDCNLLVINNINCDSLTKTVKYTAFNIETDKLLNSNDKYVQVSVHNFLFDNN